MPRSWVAVIALTLTCLPACGGDDDGSSPTPSDDAGSTTDGPHARISWRVRCGAAGGACDADAPARSVDHADGEGGHTVACDVTPLGDGNRRFDVAIESAAGHALRVRGATIAMDGDRIVGSGCRLQIDEPEDFDLEGACSSNPPSADRPCQIQRIDLTTSATGAPALVAEIRCTAAPARGSSGVTRDVTAAEVATGYAELELTGCAGL